MCKVDHLYPLLSNNTNSSFMRTIAVIRTIHRTQFAARNLTLRAPLYATARAKPAYTPARRTITNMANSIKYITADEAVKASTS